MSKHTIPEQQRLRKAEKLLQKKLLHCLTKVPDPRAARGVRYAAWQLLSIVVLGKLVGQDTPTAIADWADAHRRTLVPLLGLKHGRTPHHDTLRKFLNRLDPQAVEEAVSCFTAQVAVEARAMSPQELVVTVFDGKTLRATQLEDGQAVHLLAAYEPESGVVLRQVRVVQGKENEIVQAPHLLAGLDLQGRLITADAMHTQRKLSQEILAAGGHYLWIVKRNQGRLWHHLKQFFDWAEQEGRHLRLDPPDWRSYQVHEKKHGRLETRRLVASTTALEDTDWPGAAQAFRVTYRYTSPDGQPQEECRYGITSVPAPQSTPAQLLAWVRQAWHIENRLHYRRDVTFQEDRLRSQKPALPQVMAAIHNALISLFHQLGYRNHASARRWFSAHILEAGLALRSGANSLTWTLALS